MAGLQGLGVFLQDRTDIRHRHDPGHARASLEGVQGTDQGLCNLVGSPRRVALDIFIELGKVAFALLAVDIQQHRVQLGDVADVLLYRLGRFFLRHHLLGSACRRLEATRLDDLGCHLTQHFSVFIAATAVTELFYQAWQGIPRLFEQIKDSGIGLQNAIDHPVEHAFKRPGEFT